MLAGLCHILFAAPTLANPLALVPPEGFAVLSLSAFDGSGVLLPAVGDEPAARSLLSAFAEPGPSGACLAVGRVERPLTTGPQGRLSVTSAVARHLKAELDLEAVVERSVLVSGPDGPRLEVRARVQGADGSRVLRFSFLPAEGFYFAIASAVPEERAPELERRLDGWLNGLGLVSPRTARPASIAPRVAAFGACGALVALALRLRSRRRA
jgi:hypothetical protein